MKKWIFLLLLFCKNTQAQIPADKTTSTDSIAQFVEKKFNTDLEKVTAVYSWITSNIQYSTDSANIINFSNDPQAKVTAAFRRRKGVCENFAAIFNDICSKAGLTSFIVDGYTKQNGKLDNSGHAWCAVLIDKKWQLCDPTWDAGNYTRFFLLPSSEMIETHMPYDPMWQLLNYPVSRKQFYAGYFSSKKDQPFFNYTDTIAAYIKMDSLQKLKAAAYRIEQGGIDNDLIQNSVYFAKMNIEIIRQDKDADLYNSSVENINQLKTTYNNFVEYRNKQFIPATSDDELKTMLDETDTKIFETAKKLDEIDRSEATLQLNTDDVRAKLNSLAAHIQEQKDFLTLYLNTPKANRQSLFYNKQLTTSAK